MSNLVYIDGAIAETAEQLAEALGDSDRLHFTNGTYAAPADLIVPTTLAGFKYIENHVAGEDDVFIIAVNSDTSMQKIMDKKGASGEERAALENQVTRAKKAAEPLAAQNSERPVFVIFYDQETPKALYDQLAELGFNMASLHKWGYGTKPDAARIEAAYNFGRVLGMPLPNDKAPFCHGITVSEDQSKVVEVVDAARYIAPYASPVNPAAPEPNYNPARHGTLVFFPANAPQIG